MMDIPASWAWSAAQIQRQRWRKILVLGAMDRGKSTYCQYLSQALLAAGERVAVVDADVGQKDIGPPAAITLGYPEPDHALQQIQPSAWYFVGAVSPVGHLLPTVLGTQQMVDAAQAPWVIINTTGFVEGIGRVLKGYKIEALQPDVIVAIARGHELSGLLQPYRHYRTLRLAPSPQAVRKTPPQRQARRERSFAAYFASPPAITLTWQHLALQRTLLFTGTRVTREGARYAERTSEGLIVVGQPAQPPHARIRVLPEGFERGLLCGVANRRHQGVGLAILHRIDFAAETLTLHTPVAPTEIHILQFGDIYINREGRELGQRDPRRF
jgi:polynucleotide 5'-hydroxyl-kinase GRC3/NOL9